MTNVRRPSANLTISRYAWALEKLRTLSPSLPSRLVFDVGPGDGRMRTIESDGFRWRGFDIHPWQDVIKWDLSDPCPVGDERAAAVFLLEVIEHCINPGLALKNIGDVMEENGRLILTTPNPCWSGGRIHMLIRGLLSGFTPQDLEENHHVLPIWPHVLERMLQYAGFVIEEYVTLEGKTTLFSSPGKMFLPARYLLNAGLMLTEHLDPTAYGLTYGVVARKVSKSSSPAEVYLNH